MDASRRGGGNVDDYMRHSRGQSHFRGENRDSPQLVGFRVEADRLRPRGPVPRAGRKLGLARQADSRTRGAARAFAQSAQSVRLYGRKHSCRGGRRRGGDTRRRGAKRDELGTQERGAFRSRRRADPLDRRRRHEVRPPRSPPRQPLRLHGSRSAQLRPRRCAARSGNWTVTWANCLALVRNSPRPRRALRF